MLNTYVFTPFYYYINVIIYSLTKLYTNKIRKANGIVRLIIKLKNIILTLH